MVRLYGIIYVCTSLNVQGQRTRHHLTLRQSSNLFQHLLTYNIMTEAFLYRPIMQYMYVYTCIV